jgi:hypothetical protein
MRAHDRLHGSRVEDGPSETTPGTSQSSDSRLHLVHPTTAARGRAGHDVAHPSRHPGETSTLDSISDHAQAAAGSEYLTHGLDVHPIPQTGDHKTPVTWWAKRPAIAEDFEDT